MECFLLKSWAVLPKSPGSNEGVTYFYLRCFVQKQVSLNLTQGLTGVEFSVSDRYFVTVILNLFTYQFPRRF